MDTLCNAFGYPQRAIPAFKTALWGVDPNDARLILMKDRFDVKRGPNRRDRTVIDCFYPHGYYRG